MKRVESHTNTAALLLGLSGGEPPPPSVRNAVPGNVIPLEGEGGLGSAGDAPSSKQEPITPAAVAAALMTAPPPSVGQEPGYSSGAAPSLGSELQQQQQQAAWSAAKQRRMQVSALPRKEWSAEEDALIRNGVEQLGCRWRVIAAQLPGRSDDAVRNRWSRLQESLRGAPGGSGASSRRASKEQGGASAAGTASADGSSNATGGMDSAEGGGLDGSSGAGADGDLHGDGAKHAAGKTGGGALAGSSQCTDGANALKGSSAVGGSAGSSAKPRGGSRRGDAANGEGAGEKKERTSWTRAEDDIIVRGVAELGHKWYEIARRLPGRTDHAIRNRWSRLQSIIGMQESLNADGSAVRLGLTPTSARAIPVAAATVATDETIAGARAPSAELSSAHSTPVAAQAAVHLQPPPANSIMPPSAVLPASAAPTSTLHAPLSVATLANVERASGGSNGPPVLRQDLTQDASGGSEGSDADLTTGGAELLLLHASSQPSPQISATARPAEECPEMPEAEAVVEVISQDSLLNKRPRV